MARLATSMSISAPLTTLLLLLAFASSGVRAYCQQYDRFGNCMSNGWSYGARVGVGIAVAAACIFIIALLFLARRKRQAAFWRRVQAQNQGYQPGYYGGGAQQQRQQQQQYGYAPYVQPASSYGAQQQDAPAPQYAAPPGLPPPAYNQTFDEAKREGPHQA